MGKLTLNDVVSGYTSTSAINANNDLTEVALENTLSRDGTGPNTMGTDLDMNGYAIINHIAISGDTNFSFKSNWAIGTAYVINNLVYVTTAESSTDGGATYICTTNHTSGATFDGDLSSYWTIFSKRGATGPGTGDLLAANNLNDVSSVSASRTNLGLAIGSNIQAWDANLDTYSTTPLSTGELEQLQNINLTTITSTQWGYLGGIDQALATTDNVIFTDATITGAFTSVGIDDNATTTKATLTDAGLSIAGNITTTTGSIQADTGNLTAQANGKGLILENGGLISYPTFGGAHLFNGVGDILIENTAVSGKVWLAAGASGSFHIDVDTTINAFTINSSGNSSFGGDVALNAGNKLTVDRTTEDAAFIDFNATADADTTSAISTLTTSGSTTHHIQVEINGTTAWIAASTTDPS